MEVAFLIVRSQATLDEAVLDLAAVADAARLQRFAFLAFSAGGAPAVRFAAQHPERVSRLILMGASVRGPLRRGDTSTPRDIHEAFLRLIEDGWGQHNPAYDASEDLTLVRCPTLVLHSPHDARVPLAEGRLIASRIASARMVTFDGPNHTPLAHGRAYGEVARAISEFLSVTSAD